MNTVREVANDILTDFHQIHDDRSVTLAQMTYWVTVVGDRLKKKHLEKVDTGQFLSIFTSIPVTTFAASTNPDEVAGRKYSDLPKSVYDFNMDGGIDYISYVDIEGICGPMFGKITFARTTPSRARRLYMVSEEAPSPQNPYFYVVGDKVYYLGIEAVNTGAVEMGLFTVFDPITEIDITQPLALPAEEIAELKRRILGMGAFVKQIPSERINEGDDASQLSNARAPAPETAELLEQRAGKELSKKINKR